MEKEIKTLATEKKKPKIHQPVWLIDPWTSEIIVAYIVNINEDTVYMQALDEPSKKFFKKYKDVFVDEESAILYLKKKEGRE